MPTIKKAIYKTGEVHLETVVIGDDRCAYTANYSPDGKNMKVEDYLALKGSDYQCLPYREAIERADEAAAAKYIGPWEPIDSETWMDALECLPPMRWRRVAGVEFFQMSERMTGDITRTYARVGNNCWRAYRRTGDEYAELARELRAQFPGIKEG